MIVRYVTRPHVLLKHLLLFSLFQLLLEDV